MAGKPYEITFKIGGELSRSFGYSIDRAEKELRGLYQVSKRQNGFLSGVDGLATMSDKTFAVIAKGAAVASAGIGAALTASTAVGSNFEAQMSVVRSISQASDADMARLTNKAKEMGRTTAFSATEAGQALEYMGMAGWSADSMLSGLPGVMNLAAASGEELGAVSDIVTDAMTAFKMEANEASRFADVLAQASSKSNTNVAMMGETFSYAAPVAGSFGYSIEDTAIAVGLMANSGIKASQSGTALRKMLLELSKGATLTGKKLGEMHIETANTDGSMRDLRSVMKDLRKGFALLTEEEKAANAEAIAGKTGVAGLLAIVNAADKDFEKLAQAIDHSNGAAERMAALRLDNLQGDVTLLKSALGGAGIEIYEGLKAPLRMFVQMGSAWVGSFTEHIQKELPTIQRKVKNVSKIITDAFGPITKLGKWSTKNPQMIAGGLTGIAGALLTFKAAKGIVSAVKLFGALSGMVAAWPVAAVGLAIGGITGIVTAINVAEKNRAAQNLAEHFGDITLSIEELNQAARHITGDRLFNSIELMADTSDFLKNIQTNMKNSLESIKKSNWKLSMGIEFEKEDTEAYIQSVDEYVKNAQDYITNKGYELNLAVDIVFGGDQSEAKEGNKEFYQSLYQKLEPLEEELNQVLQDIAKEGLTLDKQKLVDDYLSQMAEVTQMITDAESAAKIQMIEGKFAGAALTDESFQNLQQAIAEYTEEANKGIDEAHEKILMGLNAKKIAGEKGMEGGITPEQFDQQSADAWKNYYERKAETILNGYEMMEETIMSTYGAEIQPALDEINQEIMDGIPAIMGNADNMFPEDFSRELQNLIDEAVASTEISPDAQNALQMLLEGMIPTQEQLDTLSQQMFQAGQEIPQAIRDTLNNMDLLGAASGNEDDIWKMIGETITESPEYVLMIAAIQEQSGQIPEAAMNPIREKYGEAESVAREFLDVMKNTFQEGIDATVPISIKTIMSAQGQKFVSRIDGHADGGIFDTPHIAAFAEKGPEAVVPLDGSRHAVSIWQEAGRLLGIYEQNNYHKMYDSMAAAGTGGATSVTLSPVYSPIIQNSDDGGLEKKLELSFEKFVEYFERYAERRRRTQF